MAGHRTAVAVDTTAVPRTDGARAPARRPALPSGHITPQNCRAQSRTLYARVGCRGPRAPVARELRLDGHDLLRDDHRLVVAGRTPASTGSLRRPGVSAQGSGRGAGR